MKNQYFGDVNDYRKYGLLRLLSGYGQFRVGVCWMLTEDDGRTDGKFISYLDMPQLWRQYDPSLFDLLHKCVILDRGRNVTLVESAQTLPGAEFFNEVLTDQLSFRAEYFKRVREKFAACDLIFYDPDNGIERRSIAKGRRNSAKYVYWDEVVETFQTGHSVLVYQHFPREERSAYIQRLVQEYQTRLNASKVYWFRTPQVVYFLSIQETHADFIASRVRLVNKQWIKQIWAG